MSTPIRFVIFGDGWRSRFFCRVAGALPDLLQVQAVIGHNEQNLQLIGETYGVEVTTDAAALSRFSPDFVAVAVSWPSTPVLSVQLVEDGYQVYCETPPAPDLQGLRDLWSRIADRSGRVQIGEQYYRMPGHAARLAVVRKGMIGEPNSVEIASTHLYHAVALIREYLGEGIGPVAVDARAFHAPMMDPLAFDGWSSDPQPKDLTTHIATIGFSDGKYGLYDFVDNQWWNPLLSRRIAVRGTLGEMVDDKIVRWSAHQRAPIISSIEHRRLGLDMNLEGNGIFTSSFDGDIVYRNPYPYSHLSEDDIAVADHLVAMGRYVRGDGPAIYGLADGIHDHAIGLAIEESARTGRTVIVEGEPWM